MKYLRLMVVVAVMAASAVGCAGDLIGSKPLPTGVIEAIDPPAGEAFYWNVHLQSVRELGTEKLNLWVYEDTEVVLQHTNGASQSGLVSDLAPGQKIRFEVSDLVFYQKTPMRFALRVWVVEG